MVIDHFQDQPIKNARHPMKRKKRIISSCARPSVFFGLLFVSAFVAAQGVIAQTQDISLKKKSQEHAGTRLALVGQPANYPDGRPNARYRLEAKDHGIVFRHGTGPDGCDSLGARDVWVWESDGTYYMHYDGAGAKGWLACLATSSDAINWDAKGPALDLGRSGQKDAASASYGVTFFDRKKWHMLHGDAKYFSPTQPGSLISLSHDESGGEFSPWAVGQTIRHHAFQPKTLDVLCSNREPRLHHLREE